MDPNLPSPPRDAMRSPIGQAPAPRLKELADQLLFPRLFRAGMVAARPERLVASFVSLIVILGVAASLNGDPSETGVFGLSVRSAELAITGIAGDLSSMDVPRLSDRARQLLLETPRIAVAEAPAATLALVLVAAVTWGLTGLFIARGAGMEMGRHIHLRVGRCFGFLRVKGPAAIASLLFVPLFAAALLLVPAVIGLLLGVTGLDIVGGIVYGIGIVVSVLSAFLLLVWLAAGWLALPAVACDGADAFDATQRAIGMLLSKPLSILVHAAIAVIQGVVLVSLVWIIGDLGVAFASFASGLFSSQAGAVIVGATSEGTAGTASGLIRVWHVVPGFVTASYAVSYAHAASVAVYLNARKLVDGQEPSELWMPGDSMGVVEIKPIQKDLEVPSAEMPVGDPESSELQE